MHGVIKFGLAIFAMTFFVMLAPAAMEPVGETAKDTGDLGVINGNSIIDSYYQAFFKQIPLVFLGGFFMYGIVWYVRREASIQRRP